LRRSGAWTFDIVPRVSPVVDARAVVARAGSSGCAMNQVASQRLGETLRNFPQIAGRI
jgi:hypothetical protein